jgi:hypothetical protein
VKVKKKYLQNKFQKVTTDRPLKNKFFQDIAMRASSKSWPAKKLIEKEIFVLSKSGITTKPFFCTLKSKL